MISATIIGALIAVAGVGISTAVSASTSSKALSMQDEAWRTQMEKEDEQRKKDNMARSRQMLENTINNSTKYKQQVGALWSGRMAA